MRQELDRALCNDFPLLFADRHAPMHATAMCWGFPDDGWEPLIRRLAEKIEPLLREYAIALAVKHGFVPDQRTASDGDEIPRAVQVKEKYGTLRFYMSGMPKGMYERVCAWIREAEEESARTCEICGAPGALDESDWYLLTLCPAHTKVRAEKGLQREAT